MDTDKILEIKGLNLITDFTLNLIEISVLLAILTLMIVEAVKYMRKEFFHRARLKEWSVQLKYGSNNFLPETSHRHPHKLLDQLDLRRYMYRLPRRLFMKQVENSAQVIMSNADKYPHEFVALTHGASEMHQKTVIEWSQGKLRLVREEDMSDYHAPSPVEGEDDDPRQRVLEPDLTMAIDATGAALERNLDGLQLEVGLRWGLRVRSFALVVGTVLGISLAGYLWLKGINLELSEIGILPFMGLIAGFLASLMYDLVSRLLGKRSDGV